MTGSDPAADGRMTVQGTDDVASQMMFRRGSRDMAALLALPAMWVDREPSDIVADLLNVLFALLRLDSAYVWFEDPAGGPALECWRPEGPQAPPELELAAAAPPETGRGADQSTSTDGTGTIRVSSISPSFLEVRGIVRAGSRRSDFPTELELYLMRVMVGQAVISIHTARQVAAERSARIAAEAALQLRNEFLARMAQDLQSPLAMLADRAAEAGALAMKPSEQSDTEVVLDAVRGELVPSQADSVRHTSIAGLTRRETEVLGLLAQGLSNKEIAGVMWLSDRTVERHITGLYRKLGVERRSEATAFAIHNGLVGSHDAVPQPQLYEPHSADRPAEQTNPRTVSHRDVVRGRPAGRLPRGSAPRRSGRP